MIIQSRLRQIAWLFLLAVCVGLFLALSFRVHSVKSEVLLAERKIIALESERMMLETEFQTRASQRQLSDWNTIEFGYQAPRADQFLENERQLASLGSPEIPGAPTPIRVVRTAKVDPETGLPESYPSLAMVSPITGKPVTLDVAANAEDEATFSESFGELLAKASPVREARAAEAGE